MLRTEKNIDKTIEALKEVKTKCVDKCVRIFTKAEAPEGEEAGFVWKCTGMTADGIFCKRFAFPDKKWLSKDCTMADECLRVKAVEEAKAKLNPLKASKRGRR
jgi:hypothetical protein